MWIELIVILLTGISAVACYLVHNARKAEKKKYYDAACKMIKETCLDKAIANSRPFQENGYKTMVYLKWKNHGKQGYVFDPERGVRIGRLSQDNEICIRDISVSSHHCRIWLCRGQLLVEDLHSSNGTWIKRGLFKEAVCGAVPLLSGDVLRIGEERIRVKVFYFDMAFL